MKSVAKKVCIEAGIDVLPNADIGQPESRCVGLPVLQRCAQNPRTYMVNQMLCVRVPMTLSAQTPVRPKSIICDAMAAKEQNRRKGAPAPANQESFVSVRDEGPFVPLAIFCGDTLGDLVQEDGKNQYDPALMPMLGLILLCLVAKDC